MHNNVFRLALNIYSKYALFWFLQTFLRLNRDFRIFIVERPKSELDSELDLIEKESTIYKWELCILRARIL